MPSSHSAPRRSALTRRSPIAVLATLVAFAALVPASALPAQAPGTTPGRRADSVYIAQARADSVRRPYVEADVQFMSGMIGHHAQAILMANMAPSHGASPAVRTLADRIINAQRDEIGIMQTWLRDREKPVPDAGHTAGMPGMAHMGHELMPGMLTDEQIRQLDAARGPAFDRLFLRLMIQHHNGAIGMVKTLFESYGAGQDEIVFKFATDVNVDQSTEVARMQRMLARLVFDTPSP